MHDELVLESASPASVPFLRLVLAVEYQADFFFLVSIFCLYTHYSPLPVNRRVLLIWAWSSLEGLPGVCWVGRGGGCQGLVFCTVPRGNCDCDRCYINKAELNWYVRAEMKKKKCCHLSSTLTNSIATSVKTPGLTYWHSSLGARASTKMIKHFSHQEHLNNPPLLG